MADDNVTILFVLDLILEQYKSILSLEKQKSETDAILSSYKTNVNALDEVKDQLHKLEKTIQLKDQEIEKFQLEADLQLEKSRTFTETHRENIELKESLKLSESELKRVTEEKKFALDELLKQTTGKGKRKLNPVVDLNSIAPQDSVVRTFCL